MALDRRYLKIFLTIVREGSIGKASHALSITQPALSRNIRQLEEALGVELFDRHAKGAQLTAFGEALLPYAHSLLMEFERAQEEIDALRNLAKGEVRVGAVASAAAVLLPATLEKLLQHSPGLNVKVLDDTEDRLSAALTRGDIDLAITGRLKKPDHDQFLSEQIGFDEWVIAARSEHPIFDNAQLQMSDLLSCRWALPPAETQSRHELANIFVAHGLTGPEPSVVTRSVNAIRAFLSSSDFLSFIPMPLIAPEMSAGTIKRVSLFQTRWERPFLVYRRQFGTLPRPAQAFLQDLRKVSQVKTDRTSP